MRINGDFRKDGFISTPSARTRYADLLRLCARIGYSPPSVVRA
ncbi:hypothetical protein [Agrobacterium tumefaciens]